VLSVLYSAEVQFIIIHNIEKIIISGIAKNIIDLIRDTNPIAKYLLKKYFQFSHPFALYRI
jgi:hypothetical protein